MKKQNGVNVRKAAMIGCGFVGSASAFALMQSGLFSELVMIDADKNRAEGEALDISHGVPFARPMKIYAGDYDDIVDASVIIITAGANQKPDETRLDLVHKNVDIFKQIIPEIKKRNCKGILLIVSNPVDILTYVAIKLSGFEENRVIGSGTVLDTARLKYELGEHLGVDSRTVHAFIIGEHGDSEIAAWSSANVSGIPINTFCEMRGHYHHQKAMQEIADTVCALARSRMLHCDYAGRKSTAGNLAFPFSPSDIHVGPVYEFSLFHLAKVDSLLETSKISIEEV